MLQPPKCIASEHAMSHPLRSSHPRSAVQPYPSQLTQSHRSGQRANAARSVQKRCVMVTMVPEIIMNIPSAANARRGAPLWRLAAWAVRRAPLAARQSRVARLVQRAQRLQ